MDKFRYPGFNYAAPATSSADCGESSGTIESGNNPYTMNEMSGCLTNIGVKHEPSASPINAEDEGSSHAASSEIGQVMEDHEDDEDDGSDEEDDDDIVEDISDGKSDKYLDESSMKMEHYASGADGVGHLRFDAQSNEASSTTAEGEFQRRRVPRSGNRFCVVCSMPAIGYNFGRITCESCKTFFRRNALKSKDKIRPCANNSQCAMDGNNRKNCPQCRLRRCFEMGMSTKHIQPPEKLRLRAKPKNRSPRTKLVRVPANLDVSRLLAAMDQFMTTDSKDSQCSPSSGKADSDQSGANVSTSSGANPNSVKNEKDGQGSSPRPDDLSNLSSAFTLQGAILGQEKLSEDDQATFGDEQLMTFRATLQYIHSEIMRPFPHNIQTTDTIGKQQKDTIEDGFNTMAQIIQRFIPLITKLPFIKMIQRRTLIELLKVRVFGLLQIVSSLMFEPDTKKWRLSFELPDGSIMPILCDTTQMILSTFSPVFDSPDLAFLVNVDKMSADQLLELLIKIFVDLQTISGNDGLVILAFLGIYLLLPSFEVRQVISEDPKVALVRRKYVTFIRVYLSRKWTNSSGSIDHRLAELISCSNDVHLAERIFKNCSKVLSVDHIDPLIFELSQTVATPNDIRVQTGKELLSVSQQKRKPEENAVQAPPIPPPPTAAQQQQQPPQVPVQVPVPPTLAFTTPPPPRAQAPSPLHPPVLPPPPRAHRQPGPPHTSPAHQLHRQVPPQAFPGQRSPFTPAGLNLGMVYGLPAPGPVTTSGSPVSGSVPANTTSFFSSAVTRAHLPPQ